MFLIGPSLFERGERVSMRLEGGGERGDVGKEVGRRTFDGEFLRFERRDISDRI